MCATYGLYIFVIETSQCLRRLFLYTCNEETQTGLIYPYNHEVVVHCFQDKDLEERTKQRQTILFKLCYHYQAFSTQVQADFN